MLTTLKVTVKWSLTQVSIIQILFISHVRVRVPTYDYTIYKMPPIRHLTQSFSFFFVAFFVCRDLFTRELNVLQSLVQQCPWNPFWFYSSSSDDMTTTMMMQPWKYRWWVFLLAFFLHIVFILETCYQSEYYMKNVFFHLLFIFVLFFVRKQSAFHVTTVGETANNQTSAETVHGHLKIKHHSTSSSSSSL